MSTRTQPVERPRERLRVLELRHAESEPPGAYGPALHAITETATLRIWREPATVDPADFDAILVLGGAMGVGDADRIPWIADEIDLHVQTDACDGFILVPHLTPRGLDEFVDRVVPLLQERGSFRAAYTGETMRHHLGL